MLGKNNVYFKMLAILLCTLVLFACNTASQNQNNSNSQSLESAQPVATSSRLSTVTLDSVTYDSDDYYSGWKDRNPVYIELKGSSAAVTGKGVTVDKDKITITSAGVYVISGKMDDGQITVDTQDKGTVRLVLNGVNIRCSDNAAIYVKNASKTVITLQEGTENTVTDGEKYVFADTKTDEPNAAIFSEDDLTINGTGKLTVNGNYNNGITGKDDLKITGGNIYIHSADDGLMGRDMVAVKEGNITIEAGGDAIKATNDIDTSKGFVAIQGGTFHLTSGTDGIQAETSVIIADGNFSISTGGGSANSSDKAGNNEGKPWGDWGKGTDTQTDETEAQSAKGIKSSADVVISGGTFNIDSSDDAIHSNNIVEIGGGNINIASGDDGIHADASIAIKDGEIKITKSYEGIESAVISIAGGNVDITAKDDGINSAGGSDGSSINGRPGQNSFRLSGNYKINIDGGYILIDASGDGIDANGSVYMSGGTVIINGPTNNGNGPLDYMGVFEVTGGSLIAAGSSGMAQAPSEGSTQYSILMSYEAVQQAGTLVHIEDKDGNTVVTFAPKKQYQSIAISLPELKKNTTYTLYSGGTSDADEKDGLYKGSQYRGGTKITDFKISDIVTWLTESGVVEGGGNPGRGNFKDGPRGMPRGGNFDTPPDANTGASQAVLIRDIAASSAIMIILQ